MRINTNLTAMNTYTQYAKNNSTISKAVEKLSSGYAINSAADNAAGLAISEKMRSQIRGLEQASTNSQDAISLVQTAEGSLSESTEILQRMRELAAQSANDTNENDVDREALQDEFSQLQAELDEIASTTSFNKKTLLDGSLSKSTSTLASSTMQNTSMSVALGNCAAGSYSFNAFIKTETAAVSGAQATTTASSGAANLTVDAATATGASAPSSAQMNGNYALSAVVNNDGSMTVTATGDNDQTYTANISAADLTTALSGTPTNSLTLDFGNGDTTGAFSVALTTSTGAYTNNTSSLEILANDLADVTVSCSGGVDATEATYGVYASLTGAEDVKLEAGMDSVTFSNGITVGFDELSETSLVVNSAGTSAGAIVDNLGNGTASTFTVKDVAGEGLTFQVGANSGDELVINIDKMDSNYLGVSSASVTTQDRASDAVKSVDDAINQVSSQRAYLGAIQNRLDHKIANLDTSSENLTAAESQIRDVDMAKEMTNFTNANILSQAATAMLAQANSLPQNVLSLIG